MTWVPEAREDVGAASPRCKRFSAPVRRSSGNTSRAEEGRIDDKDNVQAVPVSPAATGHRSLCRPVYMGRAVRAIVAAP
jgi:hypothetical protein